MIGDENWLFDDDSTAARVSRRTMLKGVGATGLAAGLAGWPAAAAAAGACGEALVEAWGGFDAAVEREFARMGLVGAAVAVVSADRALYTRTFGVRDRHSRRPVTNSTHFLVVSTTKSMSSLLVATLRRRAQARLESAGDRRMAGAFERPRFAAHLGAIGAEFVTIELALSWALEPEAPPGSMVPAMRLLVVRGFAR